MTRARFAPLLVGALLVLAGCGGNDDATTPPAVADEAVADAADAPRAGNDAARPGRAGRGGNANNADAGAAAPPAAEVDPAAPAPPAPDGGQDPAVSDDDPPPAEDAPDADGGAADPAEDQPRDREGPREPATEEPTTAESEAPVIPVDGTLSAACVPQGGAIELTVETDGNSAVGYVATYAGEESGAQPPYGQGHGGNDGGMADPDGVYRSAWTVSAQAPAGPARVDIVVSGLYGGWGEATVEFEVVDALTGSC